MPMGRRSLSKAQYRILVLLDNYGSISDALAEDVLRLEERGMIDGFTITQCGYAVLDYHRSRSEEYEQRSIQS